MLPDVDWPRVYKPAWRLERGDVVRLPGARAVTSEDWLVVVEPSTHVSSMPPSQLVRVGRSLYSSSVCCEPRFCYLGDTGRATHEVTYAILPRSYAIEVAGFLDLDVRGAVPERITTYARP
jgi:hypothetical protein